jgi:hypothetical protein
MQSRTTRKFWRLFADLPFEAQRDAKRAYRLFQSNPMFKHEESPEGALHAETVLKQTT